ncbi:MAG: family 43 glycosylhydrolase [Lachnospiraceae bacterium]|jgi:GH43 family beta-xylosidase|nr:family 43 glycosylhydrolase [Lachnospiraceae bacterium]
MAYILNYTREPINSALYDPRLAYSMHLAVSEDGKEYRALNHNSGVLFVKATENQDGSLNPKSLKNPWLFALPEGGFGVAAVRIEGDGGEDEESRGCAVFFVSPDLMEYEEVGLLKLGTEHVERVSCVYDQKRGSFRVLWQERTGERFGAFIRSPKELQLAAVPEMLEGQLETEEIWSRGSGLCGSGSFDGGSGLSGSGNLNRESIAAGIQGAVPHNVLEVSEAVAARLCRKLTPPVNIGVRFPEQVEAANREELERQYATALYSDGSQASKRVDWELSQVDFDKKGVYEISGRVHQDHFAFPIAYNRADPCICKWNGSYYFIATNDADGNHTLYIREAKSIPELVEAPERLLLDSETYPGIGGLLWAPEFHEINGRLYIFHGATPGEFFWEESHVMELREGGDPACREDWSAPKRVVKKDGSDICEAGKEITLDMTCFQWEGDFYAVWSQRQFLPKDLGAWLYIAKLNPKEPWKLDTEPVVLSKPEYGWANNHTFVDEGPFALIRGDKLYLTFSSAAVDTSYVVGLLTIEKGKDLLDANNWSKKNYPLLTSRSVEGEFGTGHNAYVIDDDGTVWNTYHARPGVDGVRSSGIRRVHFDVEGDIVLDLTEDLDLKEEYAYVKTRLSVK